MMKTSAGRGLLLILASVGLWGACSNHKTSPILNTICSDQNPCKAPLKCIEGFCKQLCTDPAQCPDEMVCSSQGFCATSCQNSDDCADDEKCFAGICEPVCIDKDQDGFGKNCPLGDDCDDNDPSIHPGAIEICGDGKDNNCNGQIDEPGCGCARGSKTYCYTGPAGTDGIGICHGGESECGADLNPGPCLGEQVPQVEVCNGLDDNCNGQKDEGWLNSCGNCKLTLDEPDPVEICGDGIDNNCDGQIDEGCNTCDVVCLCQPTDIACRCRPPEKQPCYTGPAGTLGYGPCTAGLHDCVPVAGVEGKYVWTECVGQVLPATECAGGIADGIDNNCNGQIDEGCVDKDGDGYSPPADCDDNDPNVHPGAPEICNGKDDNCNGVIDEGVTNACGGCGPVPEEICDDGLDNNCNGQIDEKCGCNANETRDCYSGPVATDRVGECHRGTMTCLNGEFWSQCVGEVLPQPEICDGKDNNCNGTIDEGCGCEPGSRVPCYTGPAGTEGKGICHGGTALCGSNRTPGPCEDEQVPEVEVCNHLDDNCNGFIDEGVLAPCGACPGEPCYQETWDSPGDCGGVLRTCGDGAVPVECTSEDTVKNCVTLGEGTVQTPYIYLAIWNHNQVAKIDTVSGASVWPIPVSSNGLQPSRTAVALDQTVWVANRAVFNSVDYTTPNNSNAVHLDADGNLICRADTPYVARSVAIDGPGNVWVAAWYANGSGKKLLYKISGSLIDSGTPPRCHIIAPIDLTSYLPNSGNSNGIYGLAIDSYGFLWTASNPKLQIDTRSPYSVFSIPTTNTSFYGITIDQNDDVWVGGEYGTGGLLQRIRCVRDANGKCTSAATTNSAAGLTHITGVAVDKDGYIWAADCNNNRLIKINPACWTLNTNACREVMCYANINTTKSTCPWGVAVDSNGKIWATNRYAINGSVYADRFDPAGCTGNGYPSPSTISPELSALVDQKVGSEVSPEVYTYSDMTGFQLQYVTTRQAHWIQRFDSGYATPIWVNAAFDGTIPQNTSISLSAVAADSEAQLTTNPSPVCGPFAFTNSSVSPFTADLSGCTGLNNHRWLMVDVQLSTSQNGVKPVFRDLHVSWTRPPSMP